MRGALNSDLGMMRAHKTQGESDQAGVGIRIAVYPRDGDPEVTEVAGQSGLRDPEVHQIRDG